MKRHGEEPELGLRLWTLALAMAALMTGGAVAAQAQDVFDCWETDPGESTASPAGLGEGFFGTKNGEMSEAYTLPIPLEGNSQELDQSICDPCQGGTELEWVDRHGTPVDEDDQHKVKQIEVGVPYDTCVKRQGGGSLSAPATVDVEIVALSLKSVNPIIVTYGDGMLPTQFDVFVTLDPEGMQEPGQMHFTPTQTQPAPQGEVMLEALPLALQIEFKEVGGGFQKILPRQITLQNPVEGGSPGTFVVIPRVVPAQSGWGLILSALVLMGLLALWIRRRRPAHPVP